MCSLLFLERQLGRSRSHPVRADDLIVCCGIPTNVEAWKAHAIWIENGAVQTASPVLNFSIQFSCSREEYLK
jgi:hypothetical protein